MTRLRKIADLVDALRGIVRYIERIEGDCWDYEVKSGLITILSDLQGAISEASTRLHMLAHDHATQDECQPGEIASTGRREGCDE